MTTTRKRYYVRRASDGSVMQLSRIIWDERGISGEYWHKGEWLENDSVTDYLLDGDGEDVTEEQAMEIARSLRA
jgi:hypothetical protein